MHSDGRVDYASLPDPTDLRRRIRYEAGQPLQRSLDAAQRRAFAVLYATHLCGYFSGLQALWNYGGATPRYENGTVVVDFDTCKRLADAFAADDYPLSDDGIQRFKMERGFSARVCITPAVALAYARFAQGVEARLNITEADWRTLDREGRRALLILLRIGRQPHDLHALRKILGIRDARPAPSGTILVGKTTALRLTEWAHRLGLSFHDAGFDRLRRALRCTSGGLETIASFITDAVTMRTEPRHDYARVPYQGHTLNRRTVTMLNRALALATSGIRVSIVRGSYTGEGLRGAHPHIGGGAVDVTLPHADPSAFSRVIVALRRMGFAAWVRCRQGQTPHIHAIAIGDREMSAAAHWQVTEYFAGRDGRSRGRLDPHRHLDAIPPLWTTLYRLTRPLPA